MSLEKYASHIERRIARSLVRNILSCAFRVSVYDGEEMTVDASRNEDEILGALATTGSDTVYIMEAKTNMGGILLVWGNDKALITDYTDNHYCASIVGKTMRDLDL